MNKYLPRTVVAILLSAVAAFGNLTPVCAQNAQQAYYIDGYHGGVWGHYPDWNTRFIVDQLKAHPYWKINLEIEPETWDRARQVDPEAYKELQGLFADQSLTGRIEYVNPSYAQSYLFTVTGESIIRQFSYGMQKIKAHFPTASFLSYSSEEPCFTSALPQILKSFGIQYASLKNPNTCWGGYTRAHGGELVNWVGPDGTGISTVPRYAIEKLADKSTWQTIAWNNSAQYINAAYQYGMAHPVGMTLQDAGWKGGPFIGDGKRRDVESTYTTWRNYFANVVPHDPRPDWRVSQEDMQVSLVWGSQVMQQIAQEVRTTENKLLQTEKLMAVSKSFNHTAWPQPAFDSAWRTLMLSQHHDCWIVPYNGPKGDTWADKVVTWTALSNSKCDSVLQAAGISPVAASGKQNYITVYNTAGIARTAVVSAELPDGTGRNISIIDANGHVVNAQYTATTGQSKAKLLFTATVPATGYAVYRLKETASANNRGAAVTRTANGEYVVQTDLYTLVIDPAQGGRFKSLIAKKAGNKEYVDQAGVMPFNGFSGNFNQAGGMKSTANAPVEVNIIENGPLRVTLALKGNIAGTAYIQTVSLTQGEPLIDCHVNFDWKENVHIGQPLQPGTYKLDNPAKPFYNDREKLLALFPLNLKQQKVYKNAPFDVTESKLDDTFFTRWDSIKNNVLLNWVDVTDNDNRYGMALLTDHTTSYAHGADLPLALNVQYSGMGLWNRDHAITGPTSIHYGLLPHQGRWDKAGVWSADLNWNEPMMAVSSGQPLNTAQRSLVSVSKGVVITSMNYEGDDLLVRLFNAEGANTQANLTMGIPVKKAQLIELNGKVIGDLQINKRSKSNYSTALTIPRFGIRTIKLTNIR